MFYTWKINYYFILDQHGMKRKLETSNANRGKKIPTPAAKCFGGTDQGGAKILVDSIEDVINQSMKEIIPINKKDHKPEINKTLCETIVSDQGEDNLNNDATNDFTVSYYPIISNYIVKDFILKLLF